MDPDASFPDWPSDWPERQVVHLDNLGDPGYFIQEWIPNPREEIMDASPEHEASLAKHLSDLYIEELPPEYYELLLDMRNPEVGHDDFPIVRDEFVGFIREWRRRALGQMQVQTWKLLQELGFQPDPQGGMSDNLPCLAYDFGNLKLRASAIMGSRFEDVVFLSGVLGTPRQSGVIEYEIPKVLTSRKLGLALIAYCLDNAAGRGGFRPATPTPWIDEGRTYRDILPWVRAEAETRAEYENRPRCSVRRDWLRLGIKKLAVQILAMPDDASVRITFDGQHLGFNVGGELTLLPATGQPWAVVTCIPVQRLRRLPRRLMNDPVLVELRPEGFLLDRTLFKSASQSPVTDGAFNVTTLQNSSIKA